MTSRGNFRWCCLSHLLRTTSIKSKVMYIGIAVRNVTLPHSYGKSHAIWDHTVLPATRQRWHSRLCPSRSWYSSRFSDPGGARLSWPSCLVTYRDGIPARRRSPIQVLTGPKWPNFVHATNAANHYATPPINIFVFITFQKLIQEKNKRRFFRNFSGPKLNEWK